MSGLFSQIQGYFKETYSGRYFAYLLGELFRQEPQELSRTLAKFGLKYSHEKGDRIVSNTWRFTRKRQVRIADIAILDSYREPKVLVEIKDADAGKKENEAQLDDYLKYIKQHPGVEFLFLSRHIPDEKKEGRKLKKRASRMVHQKIFRDLYKELTDRGRFSRMFKEYLEDTEVAYERKIDPKTVKYVTQAMLSGWRSVVADKSLSAFFNAVFSELSSLGDWVQAENKGRFKRRLARDLDVSPRHDIQGLKKLLESKRESDKKKVQKLKDEVGDFCKRGYDVGKFCKGGQICVYNRGEWIKGRHRLSLEFGYVSWANGLRGTDPKYKHGMYAAFYWTDDDFVEHIIWTGTFPHGRDAENKLREAFRKAKAEALKRKDCPPYAKQILRNEFRIP